MNIRINDEACEVTDAITIAELLVQRDMAKRHLAVEVNGEVVPRAQHDQHQLHDGDELEVVSLVGGG